MMAGEEQ
jgi:hypothetical protein